jgi:hypothetical protein
MRWITLAGVVCFWGFGCATSDPDGARDATSCASFAPPALVDAGGLPARPDAAQALPGAPDAARDAATDCPPDAGLEAAARPELGVDLVELERDAAELVADAAQLDARADAASCPAGFRPTVLVCGGPTDKRFPCNGAAGDAWCPCRYGPGVCGGGVVCCAE